MRDVGDFCEVLELAGIVVAELLWWHSLFCGCLLNLHAVLVGASTEEGFLAVDLLPSLEDVGQDHGIEVTDVGC